MAEIKNEELAGVYAFTENPDATGTEETTESPINCEITAVSISTVKSFVGGVLFGLVIPAVVKGGVKFYKWAKGKIEAAAEEKKRVK